MQRFREACPYMGSSAFISLPLEYKLTQLRASPWATWGKRKIHTTTTTTPAIHAPPWTRLTCRHLSLSEVERQQQLLLPHRPSHPIQRAGQEGSRGFSLLKEGVMRVYMGYQRALRWCQTKSLLRPPPRIRRQRESRGKPRPCSPAVSHMASNPHTNRPRELDKSEIWGICPYSSARTAYPKPPSGTPPRGNPESVR